MRGFYTVQNMPKYGPGKTPYLDSSYSLVQKQFSIAALKDSKTFEKFLDKLLWWISHSVQPVNYQILRVFSQKFSKIFRITFLQITSERQLLLVLTLCLPKVLLQTNLQKSIRRKFQSLVVFIFITSYPHFISFAEKLQKYLTHVQPPFISVLQNSKYFSLNSHESTCNGVTFFQLKVTPSQTKGITLHLQDTFRSLLLTNTELHFNFLFLKRQLYFKLLQLFRKSLQNPESAFLKHNSSQEISWYLEIFRGAVKCGIYTGYT